jgi:general secretion pathway protein D
VIKAMRILAPLGLLILLSSCATGSLRPDDEKARQAELIAALQKTGDSDLARQAAAPVMPASTPSAPDDATPAESGFIQRGSGQLINVEAASRAPRPLPADGDITFNFEGAGIPEVVKVILGDLLQENYVIAPGVGGQVTFSTSRPVNGAQAMSILEMLLSWNNATMIFQEGRYVVVPTANAVPGNLTPRMGRLRDGRGYEVRAVPLQYISATAMEKLLQPYAKPGSILRADNPRSLIVVAGTRAELQNYLDTIETFDVDWLSGMSVGLFTLDVVEADDMKTELDALFGEGEESPLAGLVQILPIERLNALMVISPNANYLDQVESWIKRLDRAGNEAGLRLFVYDVKNVKAADLADRLNDIFGSGGGGGGSSQSAAGSLAPGLPGVELRSSSGRSLRNTSVGNVMQPQSGLNRPGGAPIAQEGAGEGGQSTQVSPASEGGQQQGLALFDADEVRITAVEENNQLLIRATAGQFETIRGAILQLDTVPLQVHIEAMILDVTLNDSLRFGVNWYIKNAISGAGNVFDGFGSGLGENPAANPNAAVRSTSLLGATIFPSDTSLLLSGHDARAIVSMLESESTVNVLSMPSLTVLNNKQATINVGQQIPINTAVVNTGVGSGTSNTLTQYRDTGITLTVIPRVNPGGLVFMEIQQEDSVPAGDSGGDTNPPVNQKIIQTEVAVQSGQTVLLAGLIKQTDTDSQSGLPLLRRVPVLGRLFSETRSATARSELILLITPTVIENPQQAAELTLEYQQRLKGLEPLLRQKAELERARDNAREAVRQAKEAAAIQAAGEAVPQDDAYGEDLQ